MFTTRFDTEDYLAEGEELPKVLTFAEAEIPVPAMVENRCNQNLRKKKHQWSRDDRYMLITFMNGYVIGIEW